GVMFSSSKTPWIVCALVVYAVAGAIILPRLFAGETMAFVPREKRVFELPLGPVSGNITQSAYFVLGAITCLTITVLLVRSKNLQSIRRGFFTLCVLNAAMGVIDLTAKISG